MIERVAVTESTNSDLLNRLRTWPVERPFVPVLRVAAVQTQGRGRHGRSWQGEAGATLTFSLAWPQVRDDLSGLSLAVGVALADALDPGRPRRIGLKWPNDLVLVDADQEVSARAASGRAGGTIRKLGGILIETAPLGARRVAVIGVGLNVLPFRSTFGAAASLRELDPEADLERVLQSLVEPLQVGLRRFDEEGWSAFAAGFAERDVLRGRSVSRLVDGQAVAGEAVGVSARGELLVAGHDGLTRVISSGEVTLPESSASARCGHAAEGTLADEVARNPC